MVADADRERVLGGGKLPALGQAGEVLPDIHRVLGDELRVEVVGQLEILVAEHHGGRRLGADHGVAVAHRVAQGAEVALRQVTGVVEVAGHQRRHP